MQSLYLLAYAKRTNIAEYINDKDPAHSEKRYWARGVLKSCVGGHMQLFMNDQLGNGSGEIDHASVLMQARTKMDMLDNTGRTAKVLASPAPPPPPSQGNQT